MTAERWAQIKELFDEALEQPTADRETFIRERSAGDADLCGEALAMLRNSDRADGLLDISLLGRQLVRPAVARTLNHQEVLAGRYRIIRPIGAGGMGEVYEAEDLDLGARVAIKTMRVGDENTLARFKREIQLARTVTHPNVCRVFDLHRHHEPESGRVVTFLTMELVEGETLSAYLRRRGALGASEALPIIRQIAAALAAAHEKNVVHRDLKAGNVILTEDGARTVVTDFGLAYPLAQAAEATVTIAGTPAYMAPEQFEGKPVTAAADIYAFGVLLYEMVVGRSPFTGDSPIALALEKILKEAPLAGDAVPSLPVAWSAVIRRCLQPKPEHRYASVRDALRQLEESVSHPPLIRLTRTQKRVLATVALIAGLSVLAAWRYTQSIYTPSSEAVRLYRLGVHAQQLGLPWEASRFLERALEADPQFVAARAHLAEAWMDLDQPLRARAELKRATDMRPRWQRVAAQESLLEQAANAQLRGDLQVLVRLHEHATVVAPDSEKMDYRFSEANAKARSGNLVGAAAGYLSIADGTPCRGAAILAHALVFTPRDPAATRRRFYDARSCFEAAGDLDGVAQAVYGLVRWEARSDLNSVLFERLHHAEAIARTTGNIEQQIVMRGLLSELLLETGDDEGAYESFAAAVQLADRNGLRFFSARLLDDRARYFFDKGDFLQSEHFGTLARAIGQSVNMPWTVARCSIRRAKAFIRMNLPTQALGELVSLPESLRHFPNAALSAEVEQLIGKAKHTAARPEDAPSSQR